MLSATPHVTETAISKGFLDPLKNTPMTPAANHATPIFPRNSAISSFCLEDVFLTTYTLSWFVRSDNTNTITLVF